MAGMVAVWSTAMAWKTAGGRRVGGNRNLVPTTGPLRQTLVRLSTRVRSEMNRWGGIFLSSSSSSNGIAFIDLPLWMMDGVYLVLWMLMRELNRGRRGGVEEARGGAA